MQHETYKNKPSKKNYFPFSFSEEIVVEEQSRTSKEETKLALFEKGLANELKPSDSINDTLNKIVRMALAAEFGASFVKTAGAKQMLKTIVRGIKEDRDLRKSALMIADNFAKE